MFKVMAFPKEDQPSNPRARSAMCANASAGLC